MTTPKFKIGDRVKWRRTDGPDSFGEVVSTKIDAAYGYQYKLTDGSGLWWHGSHLSLDVPEPKKYATDLESQLGAEIINLTQMVYAQRRGLIEARAEIERLGRMAAVQAKGRMEDREQIERLQRIGNKQVEACTHLSNRLTKEIGDRERERIAKEAAQKELALAGDVAKCLRAELKHAQDSTAGNYSAYCESMAQLSTAQKELADAKNSVSNNYNAFVRGCESLTAAQKKNSQLAANLESLKSGIDKLRELASEVSP